MDLPISAIECPHDPPGFQFHHYPGRGYQIECKDCAVKGEENQVAGKAMESFEREVRKARAAENRELKKLRR